MNEAMMERAIALLDSMTDLDISDTMANVDIGHVAKLPTRYLTFRSSGIPSVLMRLVYTVLNDQLGQRWVEVHREWKAQEGTPKESYTMMTVVVENDSAEALIRLTLPPEVTVTSREDMPQ